MAFIGFHTIDGRDILVQADEIIGVEQRGSWRRDVTTGCGVVDKILPGSVIITAHQSWEINASLSQITDELREMGIR